MPPAIAGDVLKFVCSTNTLVARAKGEWRKNYKLYESRRAIGQMFVKTLIGKTITINMDDTHNTGMDVKEVVQWKEGIPTHQQRLIYGGLQLEDNVCLGAGPFWQQCKTFFSCLREQKMSAIDAIGPFFKHCGTQKGIDFTLAPQGVGNCGEWRINKGRHDIRWQMPAKIPNAITEPVISFYLENKSFKPLRLYGLQNNCWQPFPIHMIEPGEEVNVGNVYMAQLGTFKVVDAEMNTVSVFQVKKDKEHVCITDDPPPTPLQPEIPALEQPCSEGYPAGIPVRVLRAGNGDDSKTTFTACQITLAVGLLVALLAALWALSRR
jgi:hypothetical protein